MRQRIDDGTSIPKRESIQTVESIRQGNQLILIVVAVVIYWFMVAVLLLSFNGGSMDTEVKLVLSKNVVKPGETFTVAVHVNPATAIAGMQFDLSYNKEVVRVDSLVQGDFLANSGKPVYFAYGGTTGGIHNDIGLVNNVVGVITAPAGEVSLHGDFCILTCTAIKAGSSQFKLTDIILGTKDGVSVPLVLTEPQLTVAKAMDLNLDGLIDLSDLSAVSLALGNVGGAEDLDSDGMVSVLDMIMVGQNWS
jgi:hypothetical protein